MNRIILVISYISLLSIVYSKETEIIFFSGVNITPYSYEDTNKFGISGFSAETDLSLIFNNFGFSLSVKDYYRSFNSVKNHTSGAGNLFHIDNYFIYRPLNLIYFKFGNHFAWNRQAFEFDERGIFSEDRIGMGFNFDINITPRSETFRQIEYFNFLILNKLTLYLHTYNNSMQFAYYGIFRFLVTPHIKNIKFLVDSGVEYHSYDTKAGKFDSVFFTWAVGFQLGNTWKISDKKDLNEVNYNLTEEKEEEKEIEIPEVKTEEKITEKKEEPKVIVIEEDSAFYKSLNSYNTGDTIKIFNIFFPENKRITGEGVKLLDDIIKYCTVNKNIVLLVTGYAEDNIRSDEVIIRTAAARSTLIRNYMINKGIHGDRIKRSTSALTYDISKGLAPYIEIKILQK